MPILRLVPLSFPWQTVDPFLFCVHHHDMYPRGDERLGPAASLTGRDIGQDFSGRDGWSMYHGRTVPGFPQHPHRGFETVTIVRRGLVDHSDSLGGAGRYGNGDVQWLTAGGGVLHAEMFPLLRHDADNPLELFQIWLNLPAADKFAEPFYTMLWNENIPRVRLRDADREAVVTVIAGSFGDTRPLAPPPASYASRDDADVAIWTVFLPAGARCVLPPAREGTRRTAYVFAGDEVRADAMFIPPRHAAELQAELPTELYAGPQSDAEVLILQGRPIGEPVVQYGPFVMNTRDQIREAYEGYMRTQFGGWPWPVDDPTHGRDTGRFARQGNGPAEYPTDNP